MIIFELRKKMFFFNFLRKNITACIFFRNTSYNMTLPKYGTDMRGVFIMHTPMIRLTIALVIIKF